MITKAEATEARECAEEILKAYPKKKAAEMLGEWNTLMLFLSKAISETK